MTGSIPNIVKQCELRLFVSDSLLFYFRGSFEEKEAHFYTACVLEALSFLHDRGVVHRDIKPENVLVDLRGYAKLVQYSVSFPRLLV